MKVIRKVSKKELKDFIYDLPLEDEKLYDEINSENSFGIFQFSANLASRLVKEINPSNFEELIAINSLARPGTSSFTEDYISGRDKGKKRYPDVINNMLVNTNGIILFQEQVMHIFNKIGGFTLEETNFIRSLMKKLSKAEKDEKDIKAWDEVVKRFTKESQKKGLNKSEAEFVANDLLQLSSYSFNRSHAVSYSYIGAITLYLSYYFKKYFYAATLEYDLDSSKDAFNHIKKIKNSGIELVPPSINESDFSLSIKENKIIFGFTNIKGIGEKAVSVILEKRLEGEFESFIDFVLRTRDRDVNSRVITTLIKVGAFDEYDKNRNKLLMKFEKFWKDKKSIKIEEKLLLLWEKISKDIDSIPGIKTEVEDIIGYEKELYGAAFFTSLFSDKIVKLIFDLSSKGYIYNDLDDVNKASKKTPILINDIRTHIDKNDNEMAFITGEDYVGNEISFPVFASYWRYIKNVLQINKIYLLNLYRQDNDERSILFGSRQWMDNKNKILRLIKEL